MRILGIDADSGEQYLSASSYTEYTPSLLPFHNWVVGEVASKGKQFHFALHTHLPFTQGLQETQLHLARLNGAEFDVWHILSAVQALLAWAYWKSIKPELQ